MSKLELRGLTAAAFTPMDQYGRLDLAKVPQIVETVLARGNKAFYVCGSTGEWASLSTAERKEVAQDFRSRGEEAAKIIRAKADREREVILAEAERDAQRIRGAGDARATAVYANAFSQDQEFFGFYRSLNAYMQSFQDRSDVLLLQPDSKFFDYFKTPGEQP